MKLSKQPSTTSVRQRDLSRDQKIQVQTLNSIVGWPYHKIAEQFGITIRQIQYVCTTRSTLQKIRCGRKPILDTASRKIFADFVCALVSGPVKCTTLKCSDEVLKAKEQLSRGLQVYYIDRSLPLTVLLASGAL